MSDLQRLLDLQELRQGESFDIHFENMSTADRVEFIHWNVTALTDELHEALAETSWKPWAKSTHLHREAFLGELVDAFHFLNNLFLVIGADASEIVHRYEEKSKVNAKRQTDGYDGVSTKCPVCKRALDDPAVLCGGALKLCWADERPVDWPTEVTA